MDFVTVFQNQTGMSTTADTDQPIAQLCELHVPFNCLFMGRLKRGETVIKAKHPNLTA